MPKHVKITRKWKSSLRSLRLNFQCRVIFTFANKIEAIHEKSLVNAKLEPRLTSRLSSVLFMLPLFFSVIEIYVGWQKRLSGRLVTRHVI